MPDTQLTDELTRNWSSPLLYCVSILTQAALFLTAAAALTLFYMSFRPGDFGEIFIVIGLLLMAPWFLISLLPAFFGLEDKELRGEILVQQFSTVLAVVTFLLGLSVYLGVHQELSDKIVSMAFEFTEFVTYLLHTITLFIQSTIETLTILFKEKVLPLFDG